MKKKRRGNQWHYYDNNSTPLALVSSVVTSRYKKGMMNFSTGNEHDRYRLASS